MLARKGMTKIIQIVKWRCVGRDRSLGYLGDKVELAGASRAEKPLQSPKLGFRPGRPQDSLLALPEVCLEAACATFSAMAGGHGHGEFRKCLQQRYHERAFISEINIQQIQFMYVLACFQEGPYPCPVITALNSL